jgi:CRISPR-associated exonuclease Cas4
MPGGTGIQYQCRDQINGTAAHRAIDAGTYSTRSGVLVGIEVYCERYGLSGKIDVFDSDRCVLTERKKHVSAVYEGQVFQLYGQCFALREMGYEVRALRMHSIDDNRNYEVPLPENDGRMLSAFERTIDMMHEFSLSDFIQENAGKCRRCIYRPMCGSSARDDDEERFREEALRLRVRPQRGQAVVQQR